MLRYFVVHNFVVNGDSYTGGMIHNYYLHESDGKLSMIPWDYNLAFGTFQGNDATSAVNDPIDTPLSVGSGDSRPMADWIFASEEYTARYHALFREFLDSFDLDAMIRETAELIAPYVEKDPTKFCTFEEFETGAETLRQFCALRSESVRGQLDGTIPATDEGQAADPGSLVDASALTLSDMGSMGGGGPGNGGPGGSFPGNGGPGGGFPGGGPGGNGFSGKQPSFERPAGDASSPSDGSQGAAPDFSPAGGPSRDDAGFGGGPPGFPGSAQDETAARAVTQSDWIMLGVCFAVLRGGILFSKRYSGKR